VSIAGTLSFDLWGRRTAHPRAPVTVEARRRVFRLSACLGMVAPALLALTARHVDLSVLVGWAFALAASTFCPLLLLGIWWPGLTARGAAAGLISGALAATGLIFTGLALQGRNIELDAL